GRRRPSRAARRSRRWCRQAYGCRASSLAGSLRALGRGTDEDDAAVRAGDGALEQDQAVLGVDAGDGDVHGGSALATHATGHPGALEDPARGGAGADGAGLAVGPVDTVTGAEALEVVPLHDTGVAL